MKSIIKIRVSRAVLTDFSYIEHIKEHLQIRMEKEELKGIKFMSLILPPAAGNMKLPFHEAPFADMQVVILSILDEANRNLLEDLQKNKQAEIRALSY